MNNGLTLPYPTSAADRAEGGLVRRAGGDAG